MKPKIGDFIWYTNEFIIVKKKTETTYDCLRFTKYNDSIINYRLDDPIKPIIILSLDKND